MWLLECRAGLPHSRDLARHAELPREGFEAGLLALGEESGGLEQVLAMLSEYFAAEHRMMLTVRKRMAYPMISGLAASVIAPFPLLFAGRVAPYVLTVLGEWLLLFLGGGGLLLALASWFRDRPRLMLGRLLRTLALGVEAGLPLERVVTMAVEASGNAELQVHVARQSARVLGGQPLAVTLGAFVPPTVKASLEVAERTGDYDGTLRKLAALYDTGFK